MDDARNASTSYDLDPGDASFAAGILSRLADLCDGGGRQHTHDSRLSDPQMILLSEPPGRYSRDRAHTARRLREVSKLIEDQIPGSAPSI